MSTKKLTIILLALFLGATIGASAQTSGDCGANLTWELTGNGNNLTLTISGTGEMYDYTSSSRSEERRVGKECRSRWSPYH